MSDMDELVTWLRAQWDDDERAINGACLHIDDCGGSAFADRFTADRLLAEVEAKRRILELHSESDFPYNPDDGPGDYSWTAHCNRCGEPTPCTEARLLALPHAGRDGYREEWRP